MKILLLALLILVLTSCHQKGTSNLFSQQNLQSQNFVIDPARDTILVTNGKSRISILAGTFDIRGSVTLQVKEALTISDMVKAGLTTMSNGIPLQSGGMICITGIQNGLQPKIQKSIEISVPTKDYNPAMKLFSGELKSDSNINWVKPEVMVDRKENIVIENGRILFQSKCSSCHNIDKEATGPALAYITERRCMSWLKAVTRNPIEMMAKDECLHHQKKMYGSVMTSFPELSDSSIEAIYAYITKKSEELSETDHSKYDPCNNVVIKDTTVKDMSIINTITIGKAAKKEVLENSDDEKLDDEVDTIPSSQKTKKALPDDYYVFTINTFGWFNIDVFIGEDVDFTEGTLFATVTGGASAKDLEIYLIVPSKKIFVSGSKNNAGKYYFFYKEDGSIQLPQNVTAYILAVSNFSDKKLMGKIKFTTSTSLDLEVEMKKNYNIEQEINSMNLDNFEFELKEYKTEKRIQINERIYKFKCPETADTSMVLINNPKDTLLNKPDK